MKHRPEQRELAEYLYTSTDVTQEIAARWCNVSPSAIIYWWGCLPTVAHRPKNSPARPISSANESEIVRLQAEIARISAELAKRGADPAETANLLTQTKQVMARKLANMNGTELASTMRALASHMPTELAAMAATERGRAEAVLARIETRLSSFSRPEMRAMDLGTRPEKVRRDDA